MVTAAMLVAYGLLDGHGLTQALSCSMVAVGELWRSCWERCAACIDPGCRGCCWAEHGCWASGDITSSLIHVGGDVPYPSFADPCTSSATVPGRRPARNHYAGRRRREVVWTSSTSRSSRSASRLPPGPSSSSQRLPTLELICGGNRHLRRRGHSHAWSPRSPGYQSVEAQLAIVLVAAAVVAIFLEDAVSTWPHSRSSDGRKVVRPGLAAGYLLIGIAGLRGSVLHEKSDSKQRSRALVRRLSQPASPSSRFPAHWRWTLCRERVSKETSGRSCDRFRTRSRLDRRSGNDSDHRDRTVSCPQPAYAGPTSDRVRKRRRRDCDPRKRLHDRNEFSLPGNARLHRGGACRTSILRHRSSRRPRGRNDDHEARGRSAVDRRAPLHPSRRSTVLGRVTHTTASGNASTSRSSRTSR